MYSIDKTFFLELERKKNTLVLLFILLCIACLGAYVFSFSSGKLYVSLIAGVVSVTVCLLFYYSLIFGKSKLLKLYKGITSGISQEDIYVFNFFDGSTEHDGVELMRVRASYTDSNEDFERTLYFINALPIPEIKAGEKIKVETYSNIIIHYEGVV